MANFSSEFGRTRTPPRARTSRESHPMAVQAARLVRCRGGADFRARTVKTTAGAVQTGGPFDTKSAAEQYESCTRAGALHGDRRRAADSRLRREEQVNESRSKTCLLAGRETPGRCVNARLGADTARQRLTSFAREEPVGQHIGRSPRQDIRTIPGGAPGSLPGSERSISVDPHLSGV